MGDEDESDDDFTTFAQQPRDHVTLDEEIREHLPVVKMPRLESNMPDHHKRCAEPGCDKYAKFNGTVKEFCRAHGGGKPCAVPGCDRNAQTSAPGKFCDEPKKLTGEPGLWKVPAEGCGHASRGPLPCPSKPCAARSCTSGPCGFDAQLPAGDPSHPSIPC